MKKFSLSFWKQYNYILTVIISALGFQTACKSIHQEYGVPSAEYGVPIADYVITGNITDSETKNAVSGIQIIVETDTSYSDSQGNFSKYMNVFPEDRTFVVQFRDVDGTTNGEYESKEIMVDFKEADLENEEDEWYAGSITKKIDVNLNPKKVNNNQ